MGILLNILYGIAMLLLSPYLLYQNIRYGKYREGFTAKFLGNIPFRQPTADGTYRPCIWFHAVSVGETVLIAPLLAQLRRESPEMEIVLSTTSQTGQAVAKTKYPDLPIVFYAPLDFTWSVRRVLRRLHPDVLVLVELEIWPNLIRMAKRSGVRVAIVNGRLSERSFRGYRRFRWALEPIFAAFDQVLAQDRSSADRFRSLGVPKDRLQITGSLKYDGAQTDRDFGPTARLRQLVKLPDSALVFMAGSTQPGEDEASLETFTRLADTYPDLRLVLVPRHPQRFDAVWKLCKNSGFPAIRRSEIAQSVPPWRILLVDTMGELSTWWGVANIAFVGGSFGGRGGQNMIEPAGFGAAVCFGPDTRNFRDIVATLLSADAAVVVHNPDELAHFVRQCLLTPEFARTLGSRAQQLVRDQQGAVQTTTTHLNILITTALRGSAWR